MPSNHFFFKYANASAGLQVLVPHRLIRQSLELERKWMKKSHLASRHHQARDIFPWRNPPLCAGISAPKNSPIASGWSSGEGSEISAPERPKTPATKFSDDREAYPHAVRQLVGHHQRHRFRLEQARAPGKEASNQRNHIRQG
jgi:hypothetical protein